MIVHRPTDDRLNCHANRSLAVAPRNWTRYRSDRHHSRAASGIDETVEGSNRLLAALFTAKFFAEWPSKPPHHGLGEQLSTEHGV